MKHPLELPAVSACILWPLIVQKVNLSLPARRKKVFEVHRQQAKMKSLLDLQPPTLSGGLVVDLQPPTLSGGLMVAKFLSLLACLLGPRLVQELQEQPIGKSFTSTMKWVVVQ